MPVPSGSENITMEHYRKMRDIIEMLQKRLVERLRDQGAG